MFGNIYRPSIIPGESAVIQALVIGLLVPFLSALLPIRKALSTNLAEALYTQRDKNKNDLVSIKDSKKLNVIPYIFFGLISVGFGLSIYILLPLALLKQNYGMILDVFFTILMGMLLGITLLVSNF